MPKNQGSTKLSLILTTAVITGLLVTLNTALAKDKCEAIEDLDDRADCYAEKIEKKEEEYESTSKKLSNIRGEMDNISSKINELGSQLTITQSEMDELNAQIDVVLDELEIIRANLSDRKGKLAEKIDLRNLVLRNYAKRTPLNDLEIFFITRQQEETGLTGFQQSTLSHMFNKTATREALKWITILNSEIDGFEQDKTEAESLKNELESERNRLASIKADLDNKKLAAENEKSILGEKEDEYEGKLQDLSAEIEELNQKQQAILAAKYGDSNGTVGDYEAPGVSTPNPPFKPAFAAFSYGAYTHYRGMSQYGAKGRAEDGKSYKDIIKFYFKEDVKEKDDFPDELCVEGYGDMDYEDYLYGLAEMPSSWPKDALKAQAIAARSYAYRRTKDGGCICTTQSCQVFSKSKSDNPPSAWKEAVDDTKNKIIGGSLDASGYGWYSSTTGGYIMDVGWDAKGSWPGDAYEKRADSPWFRKAWYTKSYNSSDTCGHSHPWLTEEEMADILNALVVWQHGSGSEKDHISPVTTSCWGGDPYSLGEMKDKADDYGTAYDKVTGVDVTVSNGGYTSQVKLSTNKGDVTVEGETFKTVFNLRAPSYIAIRSRLYDFEKEN